MANTDSEDTNLIWSFLMAAYATIRNAIVALWAFASSRFFSTPVPVPVNQAINSQAITNHDDESLLITESLDEAKFKYYKLLPEDIQSIINVYLNTIDQSVSIYNSGQRAFFQPSRLLTAFLKYVVKGIQNTANDMLKKHPELQLKTGDVTDFSGRTFKNITAYEYAYWAMDTHMCRMLEEHMDEATKTQMLVRCEAIERDGLIYEQHSVVKNSKHFDFEPLITAHTQYVAAFVRWAASPRSNSYAPVKTAWMAVGIAQRDVPVHVMNEYCRGDRSFDPIPSFEVTGDPLPRDVTFIYPWLDESTGQPIFPLSISDSYGLGVNFALFRGGARVCERCLDGGRDSCVRRLEYSYDLAAIRHLNEVRTADVKLSLEILGKQDVHEHGISSGK